MTARHVLLANGVTKSQLQKETVLLVSIVPKGPSSQRNILVQRVKPVELVPILTSPQTARMALLAYITRKERAIALETLLFVQPSITSALQGQHFRRHVNQGIT